MSLAVCVIQVVSVVASFSGPNSFVNIIYPELMKTVPSMVVQFHTYLSDTQIIEMAGGGQEFRVTIENRSLKITYQYKSNNGSIDIGTVERGKWYALNVTSIANSTIVILEESDSSLPNLTCKPDVRATKDFPLLGTDFNDLLKTSGLRIGGEAKGIEPFIGCIGQFHLGSNNIDLHVAKSGQSFRTNISSTNHRCPCQNDPCGVNGAFTWDPPKGKCVCKCKRQFHGDFCENKTISNAIDNDDDEMLYIIIGSAVGGILILTLLIGVILYIKMTSSSVFGVYNPKSQERMQGQQMKTAFTLPIPEKLI